MKCGDNLAAALMPTEQNGVGCQALLNSVGTRDFAVEFANLLSTLIEPRTSTVLVEIVRQHFEATHNCSSLLASLARIAQCLTEASNLPPREAEVCSRILF